MRVISKKDLDKFMYYVQERDRLQKEIEKFNSSLSDGYSSLNYGEIKAHNYNPDTIYKIIVHNDKIKKQITKREKKLATTIYRLMQIINNIKDPELKSIVELRSIYGKTWEQIGEEVHMEKTTAYKKYKSFIES